MDILFRYIRCIIIKHKYVYLGRAYVGWKDGKGEYALKYGCMRCPRIKYERDKS